VRSLGLVYRTGARAIDGIAFEVREGEIVALLGRNGAGKTSTLRAISGFFVADKVRLSGSITLDGRPVLGASPIETSRRGIILVPERDKIFPNLTVAEHLRMTGSSATQRADVQALFPALKDRQASPAGLLSGGERQMLALGVAWCLRPRVLLIDELSLGLAPAIIKRLMASVRQLRGSTGIAILLVEQNVSAALEIADRAYLLEAGRITSTDASVESTLRTVLAGAPGL